MIYKTKKDQVAEFLREGVISGRFPRGARLKQVEIAKMLHISVTPVREALWLLEAEGYVLSSSHRGVVVAPFDVASSQEILELRILLECQLVRAAMERLTDVEVQELRTLQKDFEEAVAKGDRQGVRAANYRFHRHLYSIAGRPQTLHFAQILWAKYPFDIINAVEGRIERAAREHADMLEAILAGDPIAAMAAVRKHIVCGWDELQNYLRRGQSPASTAYPPSSIPASGGDNQPRPTSTPSPRIPPE
jgi:DNA-binding GntR family transcriptional regulator